MSRIVTSIVGGVPVGDAPGGQIMSASPACLSDVVADVRLGDAEVFVAAARAAKAAQPAWPTCQRRCAAGRSHT